MNHRTRSYLLFVLLIGCICYLVSHFVVQLYFVNGSSMEPTYTSGQPVLLQKFGLPDCLDYNDVVVIRHETLGRDIVKRIEKEMEYPGQIKVVVVRETRSVDYAK